jgi:hypothetical protein
MGKVRRVAHGEPKRGRADFGHTDSDGGSRGRHDLIEDYPAPADGGRLRTVTELAGLRSQE